MNEEWRDIKGYEGRYQVSNTGKVRSLIKGIILKEETHRKGHLKVDLCDGTGANKKYYVHRLVAFAFIPQTDEAKIVVNHIDGDKTNNDVRNLEWMTMTENTQHYFRELRIPLEELEDKEF